MTPQHISFFQNLPNFDTVPERVLKFYCVKTGIPENQRILSDETRDVHIQSHCPALCLYEGGERKSKY